MKYKEIKNAVQELFTDNIRLYPEMYNKDIFEAVKAAKEVAQGYWDNRHEAEIERDEENEVTAGHYLNWCLWELLGYVERYEIEENKEWFETYYGEIKPTIYKIAGWDLLTLVGTPCDTVYFHLKGDAPSHRELEEINRADAIGDYDCIALEFTMHDFSDFQI